LSSKKEHFDFLTELLKLYQFSRLWERQYFLSKRWQSSFYYALECLVIFTGLEFLYQDSSILEERSWTISSRISASWIENVVATTRWNGTRSMLTSAKLLVGYLVVEITRELDKEPSLYYPLYIYMAPSLCYNNIYLALKSMPLPHVLLLIYMCFTYGHHASYMCPDIILLISAVYVHTIYTLWGTHVSWRHS